MTCMFVRRPVSSSSGTKKVRMTSLTKLPLAFLRPLKRVQMARNADAKRISRRTRRTRSVSRRNRKTRRRKRRLTRKGKALLHRHRSLRTVCPPSQAPVRSLQSLSRMILRWGGLTRRFLEEQFNYHVCRYF